MSETKSLAEALAAFQSKLPQVAKTKTAKVKTKDGGSYTYSYADLAAVSAAVLPGLGAVGLSFTARPTFNDGGRFVLAYKLLHVSGEAECGEYPLPQQGTAQEIGSAITYARRYALCSVIGISPEEDDDGEAASAKPIHVTAKPTPEWDPVEQDTYYAGYLAEIEDAKTDDEITEIGKRVQSAQRSGEVSPATVAKLKIAAGKRKGELNGGHA